MFGLIQEVHIISTLPTSHYKYNEWLEKVEIGVCALSPYRDEPGILGFVAMTTAILLERS